MDKYIRRDSRTVCWVSIHDNEDTGHVNIYTSPNGVDVIEHCFPGLVYVSPKGWQSTKNGSNMGLWIPQDRRDQVNLDEFQDWAKVVFGQHLWLGVNKTLALVWRLSIV